MPRPLRGGRATRAAVPDGTVAKPNPTTREVGQEGYFTTTRHE